METSPLTIARFKVIAVVETVSWLVLLGAVVAKRAFDLPGAVTVMGPIHGVIFLVYLAAVVWLRGRLHWNFHRTLTAIMAAVVPFGAWLIVDRRYLADRGDANLASTAP